MSSDGRVFPESFPDLGKVYPKVFPLTYKVAGCCWES